jgi:hypothetical protein
LVLFQQTSSENSSDLLEKWPYTYKIKNLKTTQTPWDDFKRWVFFFFCDQM